ncbi:MAG: glycosyltransferase family 1 protein [Candidatus Electrothrix sp. AR3]|nr:glycosyltransferase family 1 protein [Candidatus Electrothrix sp. AR3]
MKKQNLVIGIDASNIRGGGGVTHLVELLRAEENPLQYGISTVILWAGSKTLNQIEDRSWLKKKEPPLLNKNLFYRTYWQCFELTKQVVAAKCNLLYVPGGFYTGNFSPMVSFSRNALPFESQELRRYGISWMIIKMKLVKYIQSYTFRYASGVVFVTKYMQDTVMKSIHHANAVTIVIPHGIGRQFNLRQQQAVRLNKRSASTFEILYVSTIAPYKHQWHVVKAVAQLRKSGLPIVLNLVGDVGQRSSLKRLQNAINQFDPSGHFIRYHGIISYDNVQEYYASADLCLFASSCESFSNILLESMSSGKPVVCSNKSPMTDMLGDAGLYFDPERPEQIASAIKKIYDNPTLSCELSSKAHEKVKKYSWKLCAKKTFSFLAEIAAK